MDIVPIPKNKTVIPDSKKVTTISEKKVLVDANASESYNKLVKLQSQVDARLFYTGQESGKSYIWERAGSIVSVDAADAPKLLEKSINTQSCCNGSSTGQSVFVVVE